MPARRMNLDPADVALCVAEKLPPPGARPVPVSPASQQTSLFAFPGFASLINGLAHERRDTVYSRGHNPTVRALEEKVARLERGEACIAFGSGMGAVSGAMLGLLEAGDHVLLVNQVYGPTRQLALHLARFGIAHDVLLDLDPAAMRAALTPRCRTCPTRTAVDVRPGRSQQSSAGAGTVPRATRGAPGPGGTEPTADP